MKIKYLFFASLFTFIAFSQEHFTGMSTSSRVGLLNIGFNPAELVNLNNSFEVSMFETSIVMSNNKVGFNDLFSNKNLTDLMFQGNTQANFRFDFEALGPGVALKYNNWIFGISTKAVAKMDAINIESKIGEAVSNGAIKDRYTDTYTSIINQNNQRVSGTTWGEVDLSFANKLYEDQNNKISAGLTFRLLFPGTYANIATDSYMGTITSSTDGHTYMSGTNASLNIAYSGSLANNFIDSNQYAKSLYGSFNGIATDIGLSYQLKDKIESTSGIKNSSNRYKLNAGIAVRNGGSMVYKDSNNKSTTYNFNIPVATATNPGLDLNQFLNTKSLIEIENVLVNSGYLTKTETNKNFKVSFPALISAYADVKIIPKMFVSIYGQRKLNPDNGNDQITAQNVATLTPRYNSGYFEVFSPWSSFEVSGITGGLGVRVGGFYIGSGSIVTAVISNSTHADAYLGFRWGFL